VPTRRIAATHDKAVLMGVSKNGGPRVAPRLIAGEVDRERDGTAPDFKEEIQAARASFPGAAFASAKDRDQVMGRMFKGKKGIRAYRTTAERFPELAISRARITGRREAIDTYWEYRATVGGKKLEIGTHIFSPKADVDRARAREIATVNIGVKNRKLWEWRDGKRVRVDSHSAINGETARIVTPGEERGPRGSRTPSPVGDTLGSDRPRSRRVRFDRGSLDSAVDAAKRAQAQPDAPGNALLFVFATARGFTIDRRPPPVVQAHVVVNPDGTTERKSPPRPGRAGRAAEVAHSARPGLRPRIERGSDHESKNAL